MVGGTPGRTAVGRAGRPLLRPEWSRGLTQLAALDEHLRSLVTALTDTGQAIVPAMVPLSVRGKIVYRDLRGLQVLDARGGRLLWSCPELFSPERTWARERWGTSRFSSRLSMRGFMQRPTSADSETALGWLSGVLFKNSSYGLLSSDGRRVFVREDRKGLFEKPMRLSVFGRAGGSSRSDAPVNKLLAYDLETGELLWEVGGRDPVGSDALPLGGVFILGPPLPVGNTLYVAGERDGEIRLYALDPATGAVQWSQLLALAETRLGRNVARRWVSIRLAAAGGVVVCPTGVGWLVAVEPASRSILWAARYTSRSELAKRGPQRHPSYEPGGQRVSWIAPLPRIVGNRVLFAAVESDAIECWDLATGRRHWRRS
ncbi:MAG TPA: hypothetical protein EYP14_01560, partial [Planctomycetaceae bacterium]|nr:hypothetical protein [Planctomycetaceae bacterium]